MNESNRETDTLTDEDILKAIEILDDAPVPTDHRTIRYLDDDGNMVELKN